MNTQIGIIDVILKSENQEPLTMDEENALIDGLKQRHLSSVVEAMVTYHTIAFINYIYQIIGRELINY